MAKQAFKCLGKERGSLTLAEREWNFKIKPKAPALEMSREMFTTSRYIHPSNKSYRLFCSHALIILLHPPIHRSCRYGSNHGSNYEGNRLLS